MASKPAPLKGRLPVTILEHMKDPIAEALAKELKNDGYTVNRIHLDGPELFGPAPQAFPFGFLLIPASDAEPWLEKPGAWIPVVYGSSKNPEQILPSLTHGAFDAILWPNDQKLIDAHLQRTQILFASASKQMALEQVLRDAEQRYQLLLSHGHDFIPVVDRFGNIIDVNAPMVMALEYGEKKNLIGRRFLDLVDTKHQEKMQSVFKKIVETKSPFDDSTECTLLNIHGKGVPFVCTGEPILSEGNLIGVRFVCQDLTKVRHAEHEAELKAHQLRRAKQIIRKTQAQLIQAEKLSAMGQLSAVLVHEINQPLGGIKGYAQFALEQLDPNHEVFGIIKKLEAQCDRLAKMVNNIRLFARESTQNRVPVDIHQPIEDALELLRGILHRKGIHLKTDWASNIPQVYVDPNQIQQIVLNLVHNAIDALEEGKPKSPTIYLQTALRKDNGIELTIRDNGPGMPVEMQSKIFNPFFTTKPGDKGTGLGLSITRQIVRHHGGELTVESEPGKGATFRISFAPSIFSQSSTSESSS